MKQEEFELTIPLSFGNYNPKGTATQQTCAIITHTHRILMNDMTFPIQRNRDVIQLWFNLGRPIKFEPYGDKINLETFQFNLIFVPEDQIQLKVENGNYRVLRIQYPVEFLKVLINEFEIVRSFVEQCETGELVAALPYNLPVTFELSQEIHALLLHKGEADRVQRTVIHSLIFEILTTGLTLMNTAITDPNWKLEALSDNHFQRSKLVAAKKYLEMHYSERLSLDRVAYNVGLGADKLRVSFKKQYKMSMLNFVMEFRMQKAMDLMINSTMRIQDIARRVGFKKHSQFSATFKRRFGLFPKTWRKKQNE